MKERFLTHGEFLKREDVDLGPLAAIFSGQMEAASERLERIRPTP